MPALANVSAAEEPAGPEPTTATLNTQVFSYILTSEYALQCTTGV